MGGGGTEVGGRGRLYTYRYTVTTRMTSALRWAANVSLIVRDKVRRQCPQTTASEEKGKPKRIRTEVPPLQPNALPLDSHVDSFALYQILARDVFDSFATQVYRVHDATYILTGTRWYH